MKFWFPAQCGSTSFRIDQVWETHPEFCLKVKVAFPKNVIFYKLQELSFGDTPLAFLSVVPLESLSEQREQTLQTPCSSVVTCGELGTTFAWDAPLENGPYSCFV